MQSIVCRICGRTVPQAFAHEHHTRPQAAGGTDHDIEDLCSGCHSATHSVASMLGGPRAAQAHDAVQAYYSDNPVAVQRCMQYAVKVARWMQLKRDGQQRDAPLDDVDVMVQLPAAVRDALVQWGREARDPATGRRIGMAGVLRHLVVQAVLVRHPGLRTQLQAVQQALARRDPDQLVRQTARQRPRRTPAVDQ